MATVPTLLYYASAFLMIEADSRRLGTRAVNEDLPSWWTLTRQGGFHFVSLVCVAAMMVLGLPAFRAVFWATLLAAALSFVRRERALWPRRLLAALASGGWGVVAVAATTATAGIIVGVVNTIPAFLVPFAFTLDPRGLGLLLHAPPADVLWVSGTALLGVIGLAIAFGGWIVRAASMPERALALAGGVLLFHPAGASSLAGAALVALSVALHVVRRLRAASSRA